MQQQVELRGAEERILTAEEPVRYTAREVRAHAAERVRRYAVRAGADRFGLMALVRQIEAIPAAGDA